MVDTDEPDTGKPSFSVLIAGGGVAGLEAAFALRDLAADRVAVTVLSADEDFLYRPLSIGEPFNRSHAEHYDLAGLVTDAGAELVRGTLTDVDTEARIARTADGGQLSYDALLVATGARSEAFSEHATNVDDAHMDELLHGLVQDIEEGYAHQLAIIVPAPMPWPFPGYELALMASERAWDMQTELCSARRSMACRPTAVAFCRSTSTAGCGASTACGRPATPPMFRSSSVASPPSWPTWRLGRSPSKAGFRRDRSRLLS